VDTNYADRFNARQKKDSQMTGQRRLILASSSPRRKELMAALNTPVDTISPVLDEPSPNSGECPLAFAVRLSLAKAREVAARVPDAIIVGADTSVVFNQHIMGKPSSLAEATYMIKLLRARTHSVVTGVTTIDSQSGKYLSTSDSTDVTMRSYTDVEISSYIATSNPLDKAGGYAIQDRIFDPAEELHGCYLNVIGLPICKVISMLNQLGYLTTLKPEWRDHERCLECPLIKPSKVAYQ